MPEQLLQSCLRAKDYTALRVKVIEESANCTEASSALGGTTEDISLHKPAAHKEISSS